MNDVIQPGEILEILKSRIAGFEPEKGEAEIGKIVRAGDGIAVAWGLDNAMAGELVTVEVESGDVVDGMIMNLEEETVGIILYSGYEAVKEGDIVKRAGKVAEVPIGENVLGRVLDPLGNPIDGKGPVQMEKTGRVEVKGPGIVQRRNVEEPLQTGLKAIDSMIPIGRGQRELIIGDRRTGKTAIAIDTIINQKQANKDDKVYCFYVAIGQKRSSVVQIVEKLQKYGAMEYTTVVAATASDPAAFQYLAPYAACAMAEYFRDSGKHALVIFDDLTKHAQAYRELSLLMRRSPGREAYPGDIFYLHSRLLERAAKMSDDQGGGSLTALPIVETQEGDVSAYIPTNVISITDGQIFLEADLFNSGLRPAINVGISVSRVGGDAQIKAMKQTAGSLRINLAQFRELAAFMQFSSDLDPATKKQLDRGERLTEILKQGQYEPLDVFKQVAVIKAGVSGRLDKYPTAKLRRYQNELFDYLDSEAKEFMEKFRAEAAFSDEIEAELEKVFDAFEEVFKPDAAVDGIDAGYTINMAMAMSQRSGINRDMLKIVERVTARELASPSLEKELEQIISGEDTMEKDRFDKLVENCDIIDCQDGEDMDKAFDLAVIKLAPRVGVGMDDLKEKLLEREATSSTALSPFFAIPHIVTQGENVFEMLIMRSKKGVRFSDSAPNVHALFFLIGTMDQRHFHLVALSAIAQIVQDPTFETKWLEAEDPAELRNLILGAERKREVDKDGKPKKKDD
jgi:F-type H+-transporting ATPase subunit alpha